MSFLLHPFFFQVELLEFHVAGKWCLGRVRSAFCVVCPSTIVRTSQPITSPTNIHNRRKHQSSMTVRITCFFLLAVSVTSFTLRPALLHPTRVSISLRLSDESTESVATLSESVPEEPVAADIVESSDDAVNEDSESTEEKESLPKTERHTIYVGNLPYCKQLQLISHFCPEYNLLTSITTFSIQLQLLMISGLWSKILPMFDTSISLEINNRIESRALVSSTLTL